jgi:hypothetical protein
LPAHRPLIWQYFVIFFDGSRPFRGGHWSETLDPAKVAGQHSTESHVALQKRFPSSKMNLV